MEGATRPLKVVLDTNIVVAALNDDARVHSRLAVIDAGHVVIPDLVVAELLFGAYSSQRVLQNVAKVERLVRSFGSASFDRPVAHRFGQTKALLRARGVNSQDFDLAIASVALEANALLVTHDGGLRLAAIPGLIVEDWLAG